MAAICTHAQFTRKSAPLAEFVNFVVNEEVLREEFPRDRYEEDYEIEFALLTTRAITDRLENGREFEAYSRERRHTALRDDLDRRALFLQVLSVDVHLQQPRAPPSPIDQRFPEDHHFHFHYSLRGLTVVIKVILAWPPRQTVSVDRNV